MRVDDSRLRARLRRPLLAALAVVAVLGVPAWLWFSRGRTVPLSVVLDPPRFVVRAGTRIQLRPRITPEGSDVVISWAGSGIHPDRGGRDAVWQAPAEPGLQHIRVTVRRSGTRARDGVSFRVVSRDPDKLPLSRPATDAPPAPTGLGQCPGSAPTVKLHGRPCRGANLVAEVQGAPAARIWHWWDDRRQRAVAGRMGNLRFDPAGSREGGGASAARPGDRKTTTLTSLVLPPKGKDAERCAWTVETKVQPEACEAGLDQPVFAAFSWQMKGPGHFRLAAKPARREGVRFVSYRWTFDDGRTRESDKPQVSHRFGGAVRPWRLVTLDVQAADGARASAMRAVFDRTVKE